MIATALLLFVAMTGFLSLERVKDKAFQIVTDTLPGVSYASMANSAAAEDFNCILLALIGSNHQTRIEFCRQADLSQAEAARHLKMYDDSIFEDEDRQNFDRFMKQRKYYLTQRQEILDLISQDRDVEAMHQYKAALVPSFSQYMVLGKELFDYNTRQGRDRGKSIMRYSNLTQYAVAAFAVALFILGFVVGIFRYNPLLSQPRVRVVDKPVIVESRA